MNVLDFFLIFLSELRVGKGAIKIFIYVKYSLLHQTGGCSIVWNIIIVLSVRENR